MTNEESQSKMVAILKKHGLEYPTIGEEWTTALRKLNAAFEFFDSQLEEWYQLEKRIQQSLAFIVPRSEESSVGEES